MMKSEMLKYLPNTLTFCNMAIGIFIVCLMKQNSSFASIKSACYLIFIAVIFDMLDGYLARYLNKCTQMGKQLDSFADFITFGVAPIVIFISNMYYVPWYIMVIVSIYPLAGGYRLARYNLQESCDYFTGLPTTVSGFITTTALLINTYLQSEFTKNFIIFYLLMILILSIMMVSSFRVNRILKVKELYIKK